ncbi:nitroreductase family protein [Bombilactobacillus folatiphilus]|uniref:Nitroreductase family protein n=1 Tax=Bombilactobacillus folatiphilus TaxID=2923362 RepID=A0ABY4P6W7_9LACO|nr:nitroreductase family protein [Bombilactobacillus folatiphilus]UQS81483.1 nitroreductase family protein [Bombilactobacillus folatiphilus]
MDAIQAIQKRHAVRSFQSQKLELEQIKQIISIAQKAPSWVNSQELHVDVAVGSSLEQIRQKNVIAVEAGQLSQADLPAPVADQWSSEAQLNMQQWSDKMKQLLDDKNLAHLNTLKAELYNAPAIVYLSLPQHFTSWSLYDLGAFSEALMVAAYDLQVDSLPAYQFVLYPEMVKQILNIDKQRQLIVGLGLGYAKESDLVNQIGAKRQPLSDILTIHK